MGTVTGYTAERMKAIEDASVVNGEIDPATGHLILTRFDESTIDAGLVVTSPKVVTSGTRPSGGALFDGLLIYETDTKMFYSWNGTTWIPRGIGIFPCTSATRPGTPFAGMEIYETDTKRKYMWTGTAWFYLPSPGTTPYSARVWHNTVQAIANSTTTPLIFNSEVNDESAMHTGSGSTLTMPVDGFYLLGASNGWASNNTGARRLSLVKNGPTTLATIDIPASGDSFIALMTAYLMTAGETIQAEVAQFAGGPLNVLAGAALWAVRVA
jgi:hypothetical protein